MATTAEIIKIIKVPILFVSKDSYQHLGLVKNLGDTLAGYFQQLEQALGERKDLPDRALQRSSELIKELNNHIRGFEGLELASKISRIERISACLETISEMTSRKDVIADPEEWSSTDVSTIRIAHEKLALPIESLKGIGPKIALMLKKKYLLTLEDLLYNLPRAYEDITVVRNIANHADGARSTVVGRVTYASRKLYGRRPVFEAAIDDGTGTLTAKWFRGNIGFLQNLFRKGATVILTGTISTFLLSRETIHPDYEILGDDADGLIHFKRIVPIYSETQGLHQKTIRKIMFQLADKHSDFLKSPIPPQTVKKRGLIGIREAIRNVHFPPDVEDPALYNRALSEAHRRLIYDEFFFFQLGLAMKKQGFCLQKGPEFKPGDTTLNLFYRQLAFSLTSAQLRVISEIMRDLSGGGSMNRLLQGDVGSGKTVVAVAAMIIACENGYQAALMAPTEILADQHYQNIRQWCVSLGLEVVLLTGKIKNHDRRVVLERIRNGQGNLVIGTHAIIEEEVTFSNLGLIVIDEQHRFGVVQRATIRRKGNNPHILVMTATPIPRTLAMTVYGDLDVSVIDELPPGKKEIRTRTFTESQREKVYQIIRKEVKKRNQAFIVYPLVEESESLDIKDATNMAQHLQRDIFPDLRVGLIHGRLKAAEKEDVMERFKAGGLDILVATTVIEVGIDMPEASVMVIEHAERFGLSQLHQLRGRVGRGDKPATCLLMTHEGPSGDAAKRLRKMEETNDGFAIAEEDLSIRGPGEFMGTRQSGLPDFRVGNILRDARLLAEAKADATELIKSDPFLEISHHQALRETLMIKWKERLDLLKTS
ncbi:MAG: ATP-dependent DNA helicase RecG [Smithellaceae bacterium]|nr:ATP-dependent DNA helicase RecG [Smithellaceae bacterium]